MIGVVRVGTGEFRSVTGAVAQRYCAVVLIVHAGNRIDGSDRREPRFPASQVGAVAQRVGRLLDVMQPAGVVSAPAAGADLIVLDEARRRGIPLHVFLPIDGDEFVRVSVADHDTEWLGLFEAVMDHARDDPRSSVCRGEGGADADWYLQAHQGLLAHASELAAGELVVALTVRPPAGEIPHSATDEFADRAGRAGLIVLTVDPRPT
jgi:hypothetical protein